MERQSRRRRRPALSCLECRRRKIKCNRDDPCAHCVSAKTQCTYRVYNDEPVSRPRPEQSSSNVARSSLSINAPPPLGRIQLPSTNRAVPEHADHAAGRRVGLEVAVAAAPAAAAPIATARQDDTLDTLGHRDAQLPSCTDGAEPDLRELLQQLQRKLEKTSASTPTHGPSATGPSIPEPQSGAPDFQKLEPLHKSRIVRWSFGMYMRMYMAPEFATIRDCFIKAFRNGQGASSQDAETRALLAQVGSLLQKCKDTARSIKAGWHSGCLSCSGFSLAPPSREVADTMVSLYLRSFESTHRILHIPSFWAEYHRYWSDPENTATDLRLKILLIIGIGSSLHEHGASGTGFRDLVHQWIYAAQTWLSGPLEKDRLQITGLQIHCLMMLARQIFSVGGDLVWISMGSLIHQAMQMGLHRDPKHMGAMPLLQAEVRRRLWATILEMAVQMSLDAAMPPPISLDESDTEAPSNINDDELDESTTALQPHSKSTYTTTSLQLILLDSLPTRLRIVRLLNGLRSELSYPDVLALSAEITNACRACSSFARENAESGMTTFHRNLLDYLIRRFMLPLHGAFAMEARTKPLFYYSLKASLDAAIAIIELEPEPDRGFSQLVAMGGGLFKERLGFAAPLICTELLAQLEADRCDGTLHRRSEYRERLKQVVRHMISISEQRVRQGETNVKSHMFLSMIIANAEAAEAGTSRDFRVAQAARDSLEFCYGLLQTQAEIGRDVDVNIAMSLDRQDEANGLDVDFDFDLALDFFCQTQAAHQEPNHMY